MMKHLCLLLLIGLVMAGGCASRSHRPGASYWPEEFPGGAAIVVAEHLADLAAANYPPGYTALHLAMTGDPKDELGPVLEAALRARGFTLLPGPEEQALTLVYVLDRLDEAIWYSRLTVSDGRVLTRTWCVVGDNLEMEAATIMDGRMESVHVRP